MTTERIKEVQNETAYPDSISVQQALMKVWNECKHDITRKIFSHPILKERVSTVNNIKIVNNENNSIKHR